jgi:hypothetical protein
MRAGHHHCVRSVTPRHSPNHGRRPSTREPPSVPLPHLTSRTSYAPSAPGPIVTRLRPAIAATQRSAGPGQGGRCWLKAPTRPCPERPALHPPRVSVLIARKNPLRADSRLVTGVAGP